LTNSFLEPRDCYSSNCAYCGILSPSLLQVLLVEPHESVRHCMLLYLRANGALVKAVCSEDQAISCLRLQGAPLPPFCMEFLAALGKATASLRSWQHFCQLSWWLDCFLCKFDHVWREKASNLGAKPMQ